MLASAAMAPGAPWWWLDEAERCALGLGPGARPTDLGVVFGDGGGPHRVELVPGGLDAPVRLGPASLRLWGPCDGAGQALLRRAAALLSSRQGTGFDPGAAGPLLGSVAGRSDPAVTLVDVPSTCERACAFCGVASTPPARRAPRGPDPGPLVDAAPGPVLLTGDDAAAHPDIVSLVARAARRGPASLIGPPRAGRERRLAPALAAAGLARWSTGLFAGEAAAHDAVAGLPGAFAALLEAAAAYRAAGVEVELVTPLVRPVLAGLPALVARAASITPRAPVLQAYAPDAAVGTALDALVPRFPALREALAALPPEAAVRLDGVPPCLLGPPLRRHATAGLDRSDPALAPRHPAPCAPCTARHRCPGVAPTVLRAVGDGGLQPL